ncbi:cortex morphogenetic protein CmpA [Brevibacillus fulvus]|uniref:Cortex morphogenetic protein CmpA n=1 Tax=Brevibacillus fulvus TaxID=1125967 RepID=A0A938Y0C6_9BACL|nr:cortex morphogenetic protein CmpA [Brevibacillus fulvus]MBM7591579.1 hypothetical protein [Brevibacillus fulvus]
MPQWMRKQLQRAFFGKDVRQIRLLNSCWFLYLEKQSSPPQQ